MNISTMQQGAFRFIAQLQADRTNISTMRRVVCSVKPVVLPIVTIHSILAVFLSSSLMVQFGEKDEAK